MSDYRVDVVPVGKRRKWNSPEEQIAWLEERVDSMQLLYAEREQVRLLEVKALHLANARHKRAVKSNQRRFHERDAKIDRLERELAAAKLEVSELSAACASENYGLNAITQTTDRARQAEVRNGMLLEALEDMVSQYIEVSDVNPHVGHAFMSAGELATRVLAELYPDRWVDVGIGPKFIGTERW